MGSARKINANKKFLYFREGWWRGIHEVMDLCLARGSRIIGLNLRFVYCSRVVARSEFR